MKRSLALILAALILTSCFGCSDSETQSETSTPAGLDNASTDADTSTESVAEEEETEPDDRVYTNTTAETITSLGLDGYTFNVYLRPEGMEWCLYDLYAESLTGDGLNDAVYARNGLLEEKFGFNIAVTYSSDNNLTELSTLVNAGDTTYDAAFPSAQQAATYAQNDIIIDLNDLDYLDLTSAPWDNIYNKTVSYGDSQFFANGEISTNSYRSVRTYIFNKSLQAANQLESPYELVRENKWTVDKMNEMVQTGSRDLDGNGVMDASDQWGFEWQSAMSGHAFFFPFGGTITEKNEENVPVYSLGSEQSMAAYEKVLELLADTNNYYQGSDEEAYSIFDEGRALFLTEGMHTIEELRQSDTDFGIVPAPKLNEAQETYLQYVDSYCPSPAVVPASASNPDRSGFLLQVLAETGSEFIKPEYYDKVLTGKSLRDEESGEMLDIIFRTYVTENAIIYGWGGVGNTLKSGYDSAKGLSSIVASTQKVVSKVIENTTKSFAEE